MNPPPDLGPRARFGWIRSGWFLGGFLLGLGFLAWMGYRTSRTDYHPGYERFYPAISPEASYYPTLDEMAAMVRAHCRSDQVLVIVGGNSVLQGVWQPPHQIWSEELQALLGDRYCVMNFAFRGASPTDGGAVLAECLRKEFPHQILIADEAPLTGVGSWGPEVYRYLFWQAYFTGRLLPDPIRAQHIRELEVDPAVRRDLVETRIAVLANQVFHYRDFWNRVCFEYFCTVPSYLGHAIPDLLVPRKKFPDTEVDATDPANVALRYPDAALAAEMVIARGASAFYHAHGPDGRWNMVPISNQDLSERYGGAFPPALKARTLLLVARSSPYYRRRLTPEETAKDEQSIVDSLRLWHEAGHPAISFGDDFTDDDYGDRIHLSKLGGKKLAALVAPQVRQIAQHLGYLP